MKTLDLLRPPQTGSCLIEASAGTGKTYSIAALYLHFILAGHKPEDILVVTFTDAATKELRDRLRSRLFEAAADPDGCVDAPLLRLYPDPQLKLRAALLDIDRASIFTIHSFCQRVLQNYAFECDSPFGVELLTDSSQVDTEILQGWLRREIYPLDPGEKVDLAAWMPLLKSILMKQRQLSTLPPIENLPPGFESLQKFAQQIAGLEAREKEARAFMTYDDLISQLHKALTLLPQREGLKAALRRDYKAALVDEFQDTDRRQYEIFKCLFGDHPGSFFSMIGDPKQSIYRFRGADINSYLQASADADMHFSLGTNYRSELAYGSELNRFYLASPDPFLLQKRIDYQAVEYRPAAKRSGFLRDPQNLLLGRRLHFLGAGTPGNKSECGDLVRDQVIEQIEALLAGGLSFEKDGVSRPLLPSDIAILVRKHDEGRELQQGLRRRGLKAVTGKSGSIFASAEASDLLAVLSAIHQPGSAEIRRALASRYFGLAADQLAGIKDADLNRYAELFRQARQRWLQRGIFPMLTRFAEQNAFLSRLAAHPMGERILTNYQHLGEILHRHEVERRCGPEELLAFLSKSIREPGKDDENAQRLESDGDAIRILTVHSSKGLEFPIVFLPSFWHDHIKADKGIHELRDGQGRSRLQFLDKKAAESEPSLRHGALAEDARLLYVGLTRAANACFVALPDYVNKRFKVWKSEVGDSALAQHFGKHSRDEILQALEGLGLGLSSPLHAPCAVAPPSQAAEQVAIRPLPFPEERTPGLSSRIQSFSALTRHASHSQVEILADKNDDPDAAPLPLKDPGARQIRQKTWGMCGPRQVRRSADYGNAIHSAFESADFGKESSWRPALIRSLRSNGFVAETQESEIPEHLQLLENTLRAEIPDPFAQGNSLRLSQIPINERVAEMEFHFRLQGDAAGLRSFFLSRGGLFAQYSEHLPDFRPDQLQGLMNGKADLIFRHQGRYYILDWKTNDLAKHPVLTLAQAAHAEMLTAHYILQYHIYAAALQLHLQRCLGASYSAEQHFGGIIYPFVRYAHRPGGIYLDRPAPAEIAAFTSLLSPS
ncbi:MAG: hypothetical protein RL095_1393 [Verrucomicrobiota bacterium]|jgi:exodeoxyribonuclease V beta subunit